MSESTLYLFGLVFFGVFTEMAIQLVTALDLPLVMRVHGEVFLA